MTASSIKPLADRHATIELIRAFETKVAEPYRDGEIQGFVHVSLGQEAVAAGICGALEPTDYVTTTHCGHGHVLAKGADIDRMMAELLGRASGLCGGKGGSMHGADPAVGILGANAIVGASIPLATGAASSSKQLRQSRVAVAFFGEGAVNQGTFDEAVNLAAIWSLQVLFVCENNGYAEFTDSTRMCRVPSVVERTTAYRIAAAKVDGNDVSAVHAAAVAAVARWRAGAGPALIEASTYRWHGHCEGDPQNYKSPEEAERWRVRTRSCWRPSGSVRRARPSRRSPPFCSRPPRGSRSRWNAHARPPSPSRRRRTRMSSSTAAETRYIDAITLGLAVALEHDERMVVMGIDVGAGAGIFAVTRGQFDRFPSRILDRPISEMGYVGAGVGAAMTGLRPIVEIMFIDFLGVWLDPIMNQAAKLPYISSGALQVPIVFRTQTGASRAAGAQHSQSLEGMLAHIPGLKVVLPATVTDAHDLMLAAVDDPNPVVYIESRRLYGMKGRLGDDPLPLGKARVAAAGSDVTVITWGQMLRECLEAAAQSKVSLEVIDLRSLVPLDWEAILASAARTCRVLVVHEAVESFGPGTEIAARLGEELFDLLRVPVRHLGAPSVPMPCSPALEKPLLPSATRIAAACAQLFDEGWQPRARALGGGRGCAGAAHGRSVHYDEWPRVPIV